MDELTPLVSAPAKNGDHEGVTFDLPSGSSQGLLPEHSDEDHHAGRSPSHRRIQSGSMIIDSVMEVIDNIEEAVEDVFVEVKEVLEEEIVPIKPREEGDHSRKLSALALAVIVFYKVSGGPFGCEPSVKAAGPFYTLLGFIIFPFCWCIQEALVTAELGSAFPEPSVGSIYLESHLFLESLPCRGTACKLDCC